MRDTTRGSVAATLLLLAFGCQPAGGEPTPGMSSGGSGSGGTSGMNVGGGVPLPDGTQATALLPARIRRLSVAEYQATVSAVVGQSADNISADFVPDSRQSGYTVNEAQRVDPVFARQLADAASKLAADFRSNSAARFACANPAEADKCADTFIRSFGAQAYRRPLADKEVTQLMTVFHAGMDGGSYEEGVELVTRAMLQSASFLYLTEIGEGSGATVKLTPYELAASLSYLVQGGPPSEDLVKRAVAGELDTPEGRQSLSMGNTSLFTGKPALNRVVRVMREWLGTDKITTTAKDSNVYKDYAAHKDEMFRETELFIGDLVSSKDNGSLSKLLAADWTVAPQGLLGLYGMSGNEQSRTSTPNRLGILNQSAFLSVFAHATETAPVLRGVAVMRRVACIGIPDPVNLATAIVPPPPDPKKTVRERFTVHATSGCDGCHNAIDSFGFAFEKFDGMGKYRSDDKDENGLMVDASVVIADTDFAGSYADSNALVKAMSQSPSVRTCFARQTFRALAGASGAAVQESEDEFVKYWDTTLDKSTGKVEDVYIVPTWTAFLSNPSFNYRRVVQ